MFIPQKFRIPSAVYLFGQRIDILFTPNLIETDDCVGCTRYRKNIIELQPCTDSVHRPLSQIEKTFFHELVHYIFYMLGETACDDNEKLVDGVAKLLHQAFVTAEYPPNA